MLTETFSVKSKSWQYPQKTREVIAAFLSRASDGLYSVTIKKLSDRRTSRQNRYLWLVIGILAPEIGCTPEGCLSIIMQRLDLGKWFEFNGQKIFERDSSAFKDTIIFGKIIDECFKVADFLNEDRAPEAWLVLPRSDDK